MVHYGMVIDMAGCIACQACTVACKMENSTPKGVLWTHIVQSESGTFPRISRTTLPMLCMHCENAPCVDVCPTGASHKTSEGIVLVDYDKCIGCKYCVQACPYGARHYMDKIEGYYPQKGLTILEQAQYSKHKVGVVEKCTFCVERVKSGIAKGFKPGVDPEASPACVSTCITFSRIFGDLDDPSSEVSKLIARYQGRQLKAELGTNPSVYYIRGGV
jgi:phenylacetyl-CoA:acceptor oxidoreductase subunit 1